MADVLNDSSETESVCNSVRFVVPSDCVHRAVAKFQVFDFRASEKVLRYVLNIYKAETTEIRVPNKMFQRCYERRVLEF